MAEWPPVQYPWEIKPQVYGPYQQKKINKRSSGATVSGLGKRPAVSKESKLVTKQPFYNKGTTAKRMTSSTTSAAMRYSRGLSNVSTGSTGWFRKSGPVKTPPVIYKNIGTGKGPSTKNYVKSQAGPSVLARRGVVNPFNARGGGGGGFHK